MNTNEKTARIENAKTGKSFKDFVFAVNEFSAFVSTFTDSIRAEKRTFLNDNNVDNIVKNANEILEIAKIYQSEDSKKYRAEQKAKLEKAETLKKAEVLKAISNYWDGVESKIFPDSYSAFKFVTKLAYTEEEYKAEVEAHEKTAK